MTPLRSAADALAGATVAWVATVRPDGRPHVVPVWYAWEEESLLIFSKPTAQKVRNLAHDRRAMVAVGEPGSVSGMALFEAIAVADERPITAAQSPIFANRYGAHLARLGSSVEQFAETYPTPIRLRAARWLDWGDPGWDPAARSSAEPAP